MAAGPGEVNRLTVTSAPGPTVEVADAGSPLTAGFGCRRVAEHRAVCSADTLTKIDATLGDRADRFDGRGGTHDMTIWGGPGDDAIVTGPGGDEVTGGRGDDAIATNAGADGVVSGPGSNTVDAGSGRDTIFYPDAPGLSVDLESSAPQGSSAGREILSGVEDIRAEGAAGAVLRGSGARNVIEAGPRSRIESRGGNDEIYPSPRSRIDCGAGDRDVVLPEGASGRVAPSCERIEPDAGMTFVRAVARPAAGRRIVTLAFACLLDFRCRLAVQARLGTTRGPVLAERHIDVGPDGVTRGYRLRLTRSAAALLRRRRVLRVVVFARFDATRETARFPAFPQGRPMGFRMVLRAGPPPPPSRLPHRELRASGRAPH